MITLGTATLVADDDHAYEVCLAVTWEHCHAWSGVLGGQLDWEDLATRSLELEVPGWLGPFEKAVVTDVVIELVVGNEVEAHGSVRDHAPRHEHRSARVAV